MKNLLGKIVAGLVITLMSTDVTMAQQQVSARKMKHAEKIAFSDPMKGKNKSLEKREARSRKNGIKPPKPGESTKDFTKGKSPDANSRKMKKRAKGQK